MKSTHEIRKLPQEVVNQIAAGEVIERPASVVKELVDNSIDAGATHIKIRIVAGGAKLIEVTDNGIGIPESMLTRAFEPHATSKLTSIDDLNSLITMGFRGEALSTIVSVAALTVTSRAEAASSAFMLKFNGIKPGEIKAAAHDQGTTITVEDIFQPIPARLKFLKTPETEYRKVVEMLTPYFLLHPQIHFQLEKDGKTLINLPVVKDAPPMTINPMRFRELIKAQFTQDMIPLFYEGDGIKIGGLIAHPKYHSTNVKHLYLFVNNRPVSDRGIIRSVMEGLGRFVPRGEKVPFVLKIDIKSDLVDVNVHPRKEEVRFINPYRVYTAVERAVSEAIKKEVKESFVQTTQTEAVGSGSTDAEIAFNRLRDSEVAGGTTDWSRAEQLFDSGGADFKRSASGKIREISFGSKPKEHLVQQSLEFSEDVLRPTEGAQSTLEDSPVLATYQVFKKYILVQLEKELLIIDQHAAAERITFERLLDAYNGADSDVQHLLVPSSIEVSEEERSYILENIQFFQKLGFAIEDEKGTLQVRSVPAYFVEGRINEIFASILELGEDTRDLEHNFDRAKEDILATVACHSSIRSNQALTREECLSIFQQLKQCREPYSCPHGRPIVWHMRLTEIDSHFDRTY